MNQILFGLIAFLLFSIAGIGVAEVKTQIDSRENAPVGIVQTSQNTSFDSKTSGGTPTADQSVTSSISEAVSKVEKVFFRSHEQEDEEEDDDDDSQPPQTSVSVPATVSSSGSGSSSVSATTVTPSATTFTMAVIAQHNSSASCYSAINGSVYDLTSFVKQHPGGQAAIKSLCGVDGTAAYSGQHSGERRPANELASLKIGTLVN